MNENGKQRANKNNRLNKQYKQIGNAVPVNLAKEIAMPVAKWAKDNLEPIKQLVLF